MRVRFFDIEWDTSDESMDRELGAIAPEELGLPKEVVMEVEAEKDDLPELDYRAADILSDKYGFCVKKCDFEILI